MTSVQPDWEMAIHTLEYNVPYFNSATLVFSKPLLEYSEGSLKNGN